MSEEQKGRCVMCRTDYSVTGSQEEVEQICRWVERGEAWAQSLLGERYNDVEGYKKDKITRTKTNNTRK